MRALRFGLAAIYVGATLASVLFGIEYWPLSDYAVFSKDRHPNQMKAFRMAFFDGHENQWLLRDRETRHNNRANHILIMMEKSARGMEPGDLHRVMSDYSYYACREDAANKKEMFIYKRRVECRDELCSAVKIEDDLIASTEVPCAR